MKAKNFIISGIIIFAVVVIALFFNACTKDTIAIDDPNESNSGFQIDQEKLNMLNEISALYHEEFKAAVNNMKSRNDEKDVEKLVQTVTDNFNEKLKHNESYQAQLKSFKSTSEDTILVNLQPYLDELSGIITNLEINNDADKDTTIEIIDKVIDKYINGIKYNDTISNIEKQLIIENIVLKTNFFKTIISFGDEIYPSDLKSTKKCGWFCRNKQKIACTISTIAAAGICGTSFAAIVTGNVFIGIYLTPFCIAAATAAINCWDNI